MNVAIIIPTFNRRELLKRALSSAMNQTKKAFEIIVVNDCPQVPIHGIYPARVIETIGGLGCGGARKLAMSRLSPKTEAVCYLDDDDELLPTHVEALAKALADGTPFAFSRAIYRYKDGFETEDPEPANKSPNKRYYSASALMDQNIAPVSSYMHTVKAYEEVGGWDTTLLRLEDWDLWGRLFIRYGPPKKVDEVTNVIYKGTSNNMTDCSPLTYSMMCSWRDVVSDRLRYLARSNRALVTEDDLKKFHVPKVGVVLPIFNAEKYLRESVESLLSQTYTDFEIIAVDDGSTDSSARILLEMSYDKRLRRFAMPTRSGVTKTLNYGLMLSRSEYVARMDADDISMPTRLEKQVAYLDSNKNVQMVGTYFWSMDEAMKEIVWENGPADCPQKPHDIRRTLPAKCCFGHPTVMMRRKMVESIGGYSELPEHLAVEDYELWLRAASMGIELANLGEFLLKHRTHTAQISHRNEMQKANVLQLRAEYKDKI